MSRFPVCTLSTLTVAALVVGCGPRYSAEEISASASRLSALYDLREYERAMLEGEQWRDAGPEAFEARAWYVLNVARHSSSEDLSDSAVANGEAMVAAAPENAWAWFALAGALNWHRDRGDEAVAGSDSALARSHDLAIMRLHVDVVRNQVSDSAALALIDSLSTDMQEDPVLLVRRGVAEYYLSNEINDDSLKAAAFETFARARKADSMNVEAHFLPGAYYGRRVDDAFPLLERAVALTSALDVHRYYWRTVQGRTDLSAEEKQGLVQADGEALIERRGDIPSTYQAVASAYGDVGLDDRRKELEDQLLADHPYTEAAEWVLVNRYRAVRRELYEEKQSSGTEDPEKRAQHRAMLEEYLARPQHVRKTLLGDAYRSLFLVYQQFLQEDSVVDGDHLYEVVQGMVEYEGINPHVIYGQGAIALAEASTHLDEAVRLAREGVIEGQKKIDEQNERGSYETEGDYQRAIGWYTGIMYDALGWAYFHQGRLDIAEDTLLYAHELDPKNVTNLNHLGQLYERRAAVAADQPVEGASQGSEYFLDEAEEHYIRGAMVQRPGDNPNDEALEALYEKRHGGLEGFDTYRASIEEIDRARRRTEVLADRIAEPEPIVRFSLASMSGAPISQEGLRGKIVVINFWGIWCGPCVVEMPEFQQFRDRYRDDPHVAVLTINNDANLDDVREWMTKREYDFTVLWDDGYVDKVGVHLFPTTWFVDPEGKIVFIKAGWSESLAEEFAWRVEAMR